MRRIILSRQEAVEDIKRVYEEHGDMTIRTYRKHGKYSTGLLTKHFGSFNDLKREAFGESSLHYQTVSKEDLVADVIRVFESSGKMTKDSYLKEGKYSRKPIDRHFGSWNKMLKELDLPQNCLINIPEEDLIQHLIHLHSQFDDISATILKHHGGYSVEVYQRRFGSFNKALEKAGLETKVRGRTSPIADSMISIIEDLLHEKAIPEATADWFINPKTNRKLYVDAFFPAHNIAFEYNGPQHYAEVPHYGGKHSLENRIELDALKESTLKEKGFKLLIFKYDEPHTREHMIIRLSELLQQ